MNTGGTGRTVVRGIVVVAVIGALVGGGSWIAAAQNRGRVERARDHIERVYAADESPMDTIVGRQFIELVGSASGRAVLETLDRSSGATYVVEIENLADYPDYRKLLSRARRLS
ncbi:MAG: hypothetical protein HYR85_10105 [Planctomycetes bacterium]|nr:hypothetical protein [Planctomycetota bacterium]MBI3846618.1 hypothetical protein [Planctomycetota bacterium]